MPMLQLNPQSAALVARHYNVARAAIVVSALFSSSGAIGLEFVEVGAERGIGPYVSGPGYGTGIAAADYDNDGDIDLFVCNAPGTPDQVYRNNGNGHFEEVAVDLGLASTAPSRTALWLDYNGDGRLDLLVAGDCFSDSSCPKTNNALRAYRQNDLGTFDDVSEFVLPEEDGVEKWGTHRAGMVAGDLDGDGWLDVIVGQWGGGPSLLLHNEAGARFVDIAETAGVASPEDDTWQPAILDVNGDGLPDIYWAVDFTGNRLWINQGDLTFVDVAAKLEVDNEMNDMGLTVGDYDRDGDLDLYVTEIYIRENGLHNVLYRNDTVDQATAFTERAPALGLDNTGFGWGCTFIDADHDGWLDLAVTNGWFNGVGFDDASRFFRNLGPGPDGIRFEEQAAALGLDDTQWGSSLIAADLDRDGDEELIQTCRGGPLRLLDNRLDAKAAGVHHLVVRPRMPGPNRRAIGAVVRLTVSNLVSDKHISAGTSHLGQAPAEAVFGLGSATVVDELVIAWPDGAQTVRTNIAADQLITITRSSCAGTADLDGDGNIGFADLVRLLAHWGPCAIQRPHDIDRNGVVDVNDLALQIDQWGPCDG